MNRIAGVVVGTVKDVKDPEGEGRIHVEFPWMEGRNEGYWAPPATLMALLTESEPVPPPAPNWRVPALTVVAPV